MAKKIVIPEGFIDYYTLFIIDRANTTKDIRKLLLQRQGEVRSNMTNGSLNESAVLKKAQELFDKLASAIKVFKTDERRKEYDTILDEAYKQGKINTEMQKASQEYYEKILELITKGNYNGAIRMCYDALNEHLQDYRIYVLLARSYFAINNFEQSIKVVEDGLKAYPENMQLLQAGARFLNNGKQDYDNSQKYINRMIQINSEHPLAVSEQSYLYMSIGKEELAYRMIDEYVENNPNNVEFRKNVAYDLIGQSYSCYTEDKDAYVIANKENYNKCVEMCSKAASLCSDPTVNSALENAKSYGNIEFNEENKESIIWLFVGGLIYLAGGIIQLQLFKKFNIYLLIMFILGIGLIGAGAMLIKHSYRPYWQIYKFLLTGKREKGEKAFIIIGNIFAGYIKWGLKIAWRFFRFLIALGFGKR